VLPGVGVRWGDAESRHRGGIGPPLVAHDVGVVPGVLGSVLWGGVVGVPGVAWGSGRSSCLGLPWTGCGDNVWWPSRARSVGAAEAVRLARPGAASAAGPYIGGGIVDVGCRGAWGALGGGRHGVGGGVMAVRVCGCGAWPPDMAGKGGARWAQCWRGSRVRGGGVWGRWMFCSEGGLPWRAPSRPGSVGAVCVGVGRVLC